MFWTLVTLSGVLASATPAPTWRYAVDVEGSTLTVRARFPVGSGRGLEIGAPRVARGLELDVDCTRGCAVRYVFDLRRAARGRGVDPHGRLWLTRPAVWLARPRHAGRARFRVEVNAPRGQFASGLAPDGGPLEGRADDLDALPPVVFGPLVRHRLAVPGATLELVSARGALEAHPDALRGWVGREARAVARYYPGFPVPFALVVLLPTSGDAVPFGSAHGNGGAVVRVYVGEQADEQTLAADWKLRHELAHLGLPNLGRRHRWMEEGLATYLEVLLAAKTGRSSAEALWRELADGFDKGAPRGDPLDGTRRWGETYWGGALFWFVADLEIRAATAGRAGLEDALAASVRAGGDMRRAWPVDRLLREMDGALPRPVLAPLYRRWGREGVAFDPAALWAKVGLRRRGAGAAPWAAYREALGARWATPAPDRRTTRARRP